MSLALLAACRTTTSTVPGPARAIGSPGTQTGATDAAGAVNGFMLAARQTDMQALAAYWGDKDGPARDRLPRQELEQRELFMMRCLRHDSYMITGDAPTVGGGGARAMVVTLNLGELSRSADVQVVRGPSERWYVQDVSLPKLNDICMRRT
jgi:hypothetical protein